MMIQKKSFLVLDWPLRAVNAKGSTKTFQMMVSEQGWTNIEERSCYGSSKPVSSSPDTVNIISRLQQLEKLLGERRRRDNGASPVSVHIWMSLYDWMCMRGCGWQVTTRPIIESKAISALVNVCKGMVVVCVNRDVAFHGGRGDLGTIANKVSEICKAAGALVTENDRMWRVAHALAAKNYKIPGSSNLQLYLLKQLLVEKSIDVLAQSLGFVNDLEEICINEPCMYLHIPTTMAFRIFMNGHYYLMDDFISIYYSWYLGWLFLHTYCSPFSLLVIYGWLMIMRCLGFLWPTHFYG